MDEQDERKCITCEFKKDCEDVGTLITSEKEGFINLFARVEGCEGWEPKHDKKE